VEPEEQVKTERCPSRVTGKFTSTLLYVALSKGQRSPVIEHQD